MVRSTMKQCVEPDCTLTRTKRSTKWCAWHWIARRPAEEQERAAAQRLACTPEDQRRARIPKDQWPDGWRWCAACQSFTPLWYTQGSRCRACASRASHRSRAKATYEWPDGVTYDSLFKKQGGRCAICGSRQVSKRLAIDHDHKTGQVRGLLCQVCNHELLGAARDSINILISAVDYLTAPPSGAAGQSPHEAPPEDPPF